MESSGGESSSKSAAEKAKERMERLHKLHMLRTTGILHLLAILYYMTTNFLFVSSTQHEN